LSTSRYINPHRLFHGIGYRSYHRQPAGHRRSAGHTPTQLAREDGFASVTLRGAGVSVYDSVGPVTGFEGSNDFKRGGQKVVDVINEQKNWGERHGIAKYLSGPKLRESLVKLLDI
jgi:hypothetical protein